MIFCLQREKGVSSFLKLILLFDGKIIFGMIAT
jgi:hypothetical protein